MGQLTTEDEERRRRRRERNKVAATKCRNRKKERTGILMQESDALEDQNGSFRSEIQRLEAEKRRLMDVLAMHSPTCLKTGVFPLEPVALSDSPVRYPLVVVVLVFFFLHDFHKFRFLSNFPAPVGDTLV